MDETLFQKLLDIIYDETNDEKLYENFMLKLIDIYKTELQNNFSLDLYHKIYMNQILKHYQN